jgi:shikimate kinase
MKTNVALIGFMGAGKTTTGRALAQRLGKRFVEMDALIETGTGKTITEIFKSEGEIAFRQMEIDAIAEVAKGENQVIACGGGVVLNRINVDRLKQQGVVVYLATSLAAIVHRIARDDATRPLLNVKNRVAEMKSLLRVRTPLYQAAADITVNTSGLSAERVVDKIVAELARYESQKKYKTF